MIGATDLHMSAAPGTANVSESTTTLMITAIRSHGTPRRRRP
jgi:hypothetical protein